MKTKVFIIFTLILVMPHSFASTCIDSLNQSIQDIEDQEMPLWQWVSPFTDSIDGVHPISLGATSTGLGAASAGGTGLASIGAGAVSTGLGAMTNRNDFKNEIDSQSQVHKAQLRILIGIITGSSVLIETHETILEKFRTKVESEIIYLLRLANLGEITEAEFDNERFKMNEAKKILTLDHIQQTFIDVNNNNIDCKIIKTIDQIVLDSYPFQSGN
jgi:hypothetical protein